MGARTKRMKNESGESRVSKNARLKFERKKQEASMKLAEKRSKQIDQTIINVMNKNMVGKTKKLVNISKLKRETIEELTKDNFFTGTFLFGPSAVKEDIKSRVERSVNNVIKKGKKKSTK